MDRPSDMPLVERIARADARTLVVRGPAGCGKTAAVLELYRRHLDEAGRPGCLLLAPNAPAAAALKRRLLDAAPAGVLVAPRVTTFAALAGRILAASGDAGRVLPACRRQLLLRRIVDELHAAGKLPALAAVVDTPGLVVSLDRSIAELKRAAVEPDDLARAIGRPAGKAADLLAVYRRYQQALLEANLYDVEGQHWQARELLARAVDADQPLPGLEGVSVVAADGFTDFTPTQLAMLRLLGRRLDRVVVTLPHADDARPRMWHWTTRTLNHLRREMSEQLGEIVAEPADPPLSPVWSTLFDLDAPHQSLPDDVHIIAAAGTDAEIAAVARRVKQLLAAGEPPASLAVLARSMETYRPTIQQIFAAHDLPVAPAPTALTDAPIVRFVLDVAALAPELPFRGVLAAIANSYFRPQALGEFDPAHVAAAQMLIREGNVLAGRQAYADAAERLARRAERHGENNDDEDFALGSLRACPQLIRQAAEMLEKLFDLADKTAADGDVAGLIDALELEAAARQSGSAELIARDLRALGELRAALAGAGQPAPPIAHLRQALAAATCPPARGEALVDVLDVLDGRALRYRHVFLVGLSEGSFPQPPAETSLIGQGERARWAAGGIELDCRADLTAREMLLFYLAVSRADRSLTLSYQTADAAGRPSAPSTFLQSLLEPFGGMDAVEQAGRLSRIGPGEMTEPGSPTASRRDALILGVAGLLAPNATPAPGELAWAATNRPQTLRRLAGGLLAQHRRWHGDQCDRYDGRLTDPALLAELAGRFPARTVFSASQLNTYGQCPWRFFAEYILRLEPLAEPTRRLEPVTAGLFVHAVLFRVMRRLSEQAGGEFSLRQFEEDQVLAALDEAVAAEAAQVEAVSPPYPALWEIQKRQMHEQLRGYLLAQRGSERNLTHLHFELGFGLETFEGEETDPASTAEPVELSTPGGTIRLRGKIDRVDRTIGDEKAGLFVVDYKTGRLPRHIDIRAARSAQLPLYTLAARKLLGADCLGGAIHHIADGKEMHFSSLKPPRGEKRLLDERLDEVMQHVGGFVRGMSEGRFDALPTHECPSWCAYRQVCHYSPARAQLKSPPITRIAQSDTKQKKGGATKANLAEGQA